MKINCKICKIEIDQTGKGRPKNYCSSRCRMHARAQRRAETGLGSYPRKIQPLPEESICFLCNKKFDVKIDFPNYSSAIRRSKTILCLGCSKKKARNCASCFSIFNPTNLSKTSCYCLLCSRKFRRQYKQNVKIADFFEIRECLYCLKSFKPKQLRSTCCSHRCQCSFKIFQKNTGLTARASLLTLCDCGKLIGKRFHKCRECSIKALSERRNKSDVRRRIAVLKGDHGIHWRSVGDRDDWICHLCGGEVLHKAGTAFVPNGATVDHLIPIAKGGSHTWGNVALAHRFCNVSRGDKDLESVCVES